MTTTIYQYRGRQYVVRECEIVRVTMLLASGKERRTAMRSDVIRSLGQVIGQTDYPQADPLDRYRSNGRVGLGS